MHGFPWKVGKRSWIFTIAQCFETWLGRGHQTCDSSLPKHLGRVVRFTSKDALENVAVSQGRAYLGRNNDLTITLDLQTEGSRPLKRC